MFGITIPTQLPGRSELPAAAQQTWVIWLGMFALGIGFGVLVVDHGLPWWLAPIISAPMFAGSVEFVLIGMLTAGAPIAAIAATTLLINSRHLFYGLSYPLHRIHGWAAKAYGVFSMCDEAYAMATSIDDGSTPSRRVLWRQFGMHTSWASGSLAGAAVGATLLGGVKGLGFILIALFLALALDAWHARPDLTTLALAISAAVIARILAPAGMLLVAMSLFTAALVLRHLVHRMSA